jgi:hypothetical protein
MRTLKVTALGATPRSVISSSSLRHGPRAQLSAARRTRAARHASGVGSGAARSPQPLLQPAWLAVLRSTG